MRRVVSIPQHRYTSMPAHVQRLEGGERDGHLGLVIRVLVQRREVGVELARQRNVRVRLQDPSPGMGQQPRSHVADKAGRTWMDSAFCTDSTLNRYGRSVYEPPSSAGSLCSDAGGRRRTHRRQALEAATDRETDRPQAHLDALAQQLGGLPAAEDARRPVRVGAHPVAACPVSDLLPLNPRRRAASAAYQSSAYATLGSTRKVLSAAACTHARTHARRQRVSASAPRVWRSGPGSHAPHLELRDGALEPGLAPRVGLRDALELEHGGGSRSRRCAEMRKCGECGLDAK